MIGAKSNLATGNKVSSNKDSGFYNTIHLTGQELKKAKKQTENQATKVLDFLKSNPNNSYTKHEITVHLIELGKINAKTPESSISRTLSDLKDLNLVTKLEAMRPGEFDKPNHLWRFKTCISTQIATQTIIFS